MTIFRIVSAVLLSSLTATALLTAQTRIEPIRAQQAGPVRFASLDVADGTFAVFGRDDAFARHLGVSDFIADQVQISGRLQVFAVSGGDPTRANFVCSTADGVLFGSVVPCSDVRLAPATH
jgi:hypothetical protein